MLKMKVLWVLPGKEDDIIGMIFSRRQINSLTDLGIEGKVFYLRSRTNPLTVLSEMKRLKELLHSYKPDIVHSHYGSITGLVVAISTKLPIVITFQGSDLNKTPTDGLIRDFIGRKASALSASKAKSIICVSSRLKQNLSLKNKIKTQIIPFGINTSLFQPRDKIQTRRELGWDLDEKVVLFNANNPKIKRLDLALEIIEKIKSQVPLSRLEILRGDIPPDRVPLLLNAADALLLCSNSEGSPMIIKEAMACNLPIVSNDVGDVSERISKVSGCYIVEQNSHIMANTLALCLTSGKLSNGRKILENDKLSEEEISFKVINLYKEVLKS